MDNFVKDLQGMWLPITILSLSLSLSLSPMSSCSCSCSCPLLFLLFSSPYAPSPSAIIFFLKCITERKIRLVIFDLDKTITQKHTKGFLAEKDLTSFRSAIAPVRVLNNLLLCRSFPSDILIAFHPGGMT